MDSLTVDLVWALVAAMIVTAGGWLWQRARPWRQIKSLCARVWAHLHRQQLAEIAELREDVNALLMVLDHWTTPGAGDKQRQFEYMAEALRARGASRRAARCRAVLPCA